MSLKNNNLIRKTANYFLGIDGFYQSAASFVVENITRGINRQIFLNSLKKRKIEKLVFNSLINITEIYATSRDIRIFALMTPALEFMRYAFYKKLNSEQQEFNDWKSKILYESKYETLEEIMENYDRKQEEKLYEDREEE